MRFNAFNFAGMKKSTIWVLGIVMGLSFLSLLYLQVSYIEEMVKMRKGQFDAVSYTHLTLPTTSRV